MEERPRDETRRRVLLGLGAIGAGAVRAGVVFSTQPGVEAGIGRAPSTEPAVTPPRSRRTPQTTPTTSVDGTTPTAPIEPTTTTTPVATVVAACREAWQAQPVSGAMVEHVPQRLTLHHTAVSQTALTQGPARARQHQQYHQSLGWPDLAYHFLVDRSGLAYEGRDVRFRGDTATEYDPTGHFLVCMEGDFDVQDPTAAQVETTVALFAWASQQYGIGASTLAGHADYADSTTCPGASVTAMIPALTVAVADAGPVVIDLVCGSSGADLVGALEAG